MTKSELEARLINFSNSIIALATIMENDFASQHLSRQIIRSGTSCALNYGEAQGAPTKKDFIHKIGIVLKELRETSINLKIIDASSMVKGNDTLKNIIRENGELIAIFTKTIQTARRNENK